MQLMKHHKALYYKLNAAKGEKDSNCRESEL
jgi:hypothetical protein